MAPTTKYLAGLIALFAIQSFSLYNDIPVHPRAHQDVDSSAYLEKATSLLETGSLVPMGAPIPYYTLGYATLVGSLFQLCKKPCISLVIAFQVILGCCLIILAYLLGCLVGGPCVGRNAAAIACVNVGLLTFAQFVLTEMVLTFLLTSFLYALAYGCIRKWTPAYLLAGLALGCSVLIKPAALYFPLVLVPLMLGAWVVRQQPSLQVITLFCVAYLVPIGSYMSAWRYQHGVWHLSNMDAMNLTVWFYPYVRASLYNANVQTERSVLSARYAQPGGPESLKAEVKEVIIQHPVLCARLWLFNVAKTWLGLFASNLKVLINPDLPHGHEISFFSTQGNLLTRLVTYIQKGSPSFRVTFYAWGEAIWSLVRIPLLIIGLYALYLQLGWYGLLLMLSYLAYFSGITGHDGCARFRMMFEMPLIVLAALGICYLGNKQHKALVP